MVQKLLVGNKDTVLLIPAYEVDGVPQMAYSASPDPVPLTAPTAALLNHYIDALAPDDTGAAWGGNVTCSIIDDWNLAFTDSTFDDTRTLCSVGQSQEPTFYNYDAEINVLRDIDPKDATSEFNLVANLISAPDIAYVIAHRIGYGRTVDAAIGQEWHFYYIWTDHSVPTAADGDYQTLGQTFIPKGIINFKYEVAA
jgi:hypothetical protein